MKGLWMVSKVCLVI